MLRAIAAVVVGYAIVGILIFCTDQVFSLIIPNFKTLHDLPAYYFGISIVTDTLYSIAGGWVCASIARSHANMSILFLIAFGECAGLAATVWNWGVVPHYFSYALMLLYPPAIWFGGRLKRTNEASRAAAA